MRNFSQVFRHMWRADAGMTLVEVLAATAVTAMLTTVVVSLLVSLMGGARRMRTATDNYESLRVAAGVFVQDTRFAINVSFDPDHIKLYTSTGTADYILYKFATWDGDPAAGTPDAQHLHRWVIRGGTLQRDDVVGWNLLPPDGTPDTTWFQATGGQRNRTATLHMVKAPLHGQTEGAHLEVTGFMR